MGYPSIVVAGAVFPLVVLVKRFDFGDQVLVVGGGLDRELRVTHRCRFVRPAVPSEFFAARSLYVSISFFFTDYFSQLF